MMDKSVKAKDEKPATTETQKVSEAHKFSPSADGSDNFSDSVAARESLKQKLEESENKYKRALADYQNLEKRVVEERKDWRGKSNKELLLRLLPVLDTLMLAAKHSRDEGVVLSVQQFLDALKFEGVEKIETIGKSFDPHSMECIDTGEGEVDKVLKEFRAGYTLNGQILRSAQVQVGKKRKEEQEEEKAKKELQKGDYM